MLNDSSLMWKAGSVLLTVVILSAAVDSSEVTKDLSEVQRDAGWTITGGISTDLVLRSLFSESSKTAGTSRKLLQRAGSTIICAGNALYICSI